MDSFQNLLKYMFYQMNSKKLLLILFVACYNMIISSVLKITGIQIFPNFYKFTGRRQVFFLQYDKQIKIMFI